MENVSDYSRQYRIKPGEIATLVVSHSEVCMHMRVAGKVMQCQLLPSESHGAIAQLLNDNGTPFSAPILTGEAGFYQDSEGYYYYPPKR